MTRPLVVMDLGGVLVLGNCCHALDPVGATELYGIPEAPQVSPENR